MTLRVVTSENDLYKFDNMGAFLCIFGNTPENVKYVEPATLEQAKILDDMGFNVFTLPSTPTNEPKKIVGDSFAITYKNDENAVFVVDYIFTQHNMIWYIGSVTYYDSDGRKTTIRGHQINEKSLS